MRRPGMEFALAAMGTVLCVACMAMMGGMAAKGIGRLLRRDDR
jgi:hypothetical protein